MRADSKISPGNPCTDHETPLTISMCSRRSDYQRIGLRPQAVGTPHQFPAWVSRIAQFVPTRLSQWDLKHDQCWYQDLASFSLCSPQHRAPIIITLRQQVS
eukprot:3262753-Rhodomonas_salina.3